MSLTKLTSKAKRFIFGIGETIGQSNKGPLDQLLTHQESENKPDCAAVQGYHSVIVRERTIKLLHNCSWIANALINHVMPLNGDIETECRRYRLLKAMAEFKRAANNIKQSNIGETWDIDIYGIDRFTTSLAKDLRKYCCIFKARNRLHKIICERPSLWGGESYRRDIACIRFRDLLFKCGYVAENLINRTMLNRRDIETDLQRARLLNALSDFMLAVGDIKESDISKVDDVGIKDINLHIDTHVKNLINWTSRLKDAALLTR